MILFDKPYHKALILLASGAIFLSSAEALAKSIYIANSGFESGFKNWKSTKQVAISATKRKGSFSAKITDEKGLLSRLIDVKKNTNYELSAFIRSAGTIGVDVGGKILLSSSEKGSGWTKTVVSFNSGNNESVTILGVYNGSVSYFDEFKLKAVKSLNATSTSQ